MITENIIKNLKKELEDRDERIKLLKIKNGELNSIYNDWICNDLSKEKKKFPEDYIKQKEEFAQALLTEKRNIVFNDFIAHIKILILPNDAGARPIFFHQINCYFSNNLSIA